MHKINTPLRYSDFMNAVLQNIDFSEDETEKSKKIITSNIKTILESYYEDHKEEDNDETECLVCNVIFQTYTEPDKWKEYKRCGEKTHLYLCETIKRINRAFLSAYIPISYEYKFNKNEFASMIFLKRFISALERDSVEFTLKEKKEFYIIKMEDEVRMVNATRPSIIY